MCRFVKVYSVLLVFIGLLPILLLSPLEVIAEETTDKKLNIYVFKLVDIDGLENTTDQNDLGLCIWKKKDAGNGFDPVQFQSQNYIDLESPLTFVQFSQSEQNEASQVSTEALHLAIPWPNFIQSINFARSQSQGKIDELKKFLIKKGLPAGVTLGGYFVTRNFVLPESISVADELARNFDLFSSYYGTFSHVISKFLREHGLTEAALITGKVITTSVAAGLNSELRKFDSESVQKLGDYLLEKFSLSNGETNQGCLFENIDQIQSLVMSNQFLEEKKSATFLDSSIPLEYIVFNAEYYSQLKTSLENRVKCRL